MTKTALLCGAAALALGGGTAIANSAHPTVAGKAVHPFHYVLPHGPSALAGYSQRDNDNGVGIVSQNFESAFDAYDAQGADDFSIKKKAKIKEVDADGAYFNGAGPATSFNVIFYKDAGGLPGAQQKACMNASYTDETGFGTPDITCKAKVKGAGTHWVSVQANLSFGVGGEWGWNTNNTVRGNPSQWQNPGGGFATGCNSWATTTTCIPSGEGGDFSYALLGKVK